MQCNTFAEAQHCSILEAQQCTIDTNHKPLTYTFSQRCDKLRPVQQNHLLFIAQFATDSQHVSRKDNVVADALPRVATIDPVHITVDVLPRLRPRTLNCRNFARARPHYICNKSPF